MKVILHIGTSKTGTSALQRSLARAAEEPDVWSFGYPTWPERNDAHHTLASAFVSRAYMPRLLTDGGRRSEADVRQDGINAWAVIKLSAPAHDLMVISSEYLFAISEEGAHILAGLVEDIADEVEVACYVRPPAAHYVASLSQRVRASRHVIRPCDHRLDARQRLARFTEAFGGRVTVRSYERDRLIGGDIIEDFRATFLPDLPPLPRPTAKGDNRSLSAEAICLLHELRGHAWTDEERQHSPSSNAVQQALLGIDDGPSASTASLRPGLAEAITWAPDVDLAYLADEHGLELERATAPAEPCPGWTTESVQEILAVEPDRLDALRARLVRQLADQLVLARDRIGRLEQRLAKAKGEDA
ncbi:MAG: hypothetical protein R2702_00465 [Acidimicrobiales bacterium]